MLLPGLLVVALPLPSLGDSFRVRATHDDRWDPSSRNVVRGDRVVWSNPTGVEHNVTAYGGNWSKSTTLLTGDRTAKTFRQTGTYRYRCTFHSRLSGGRCSGPMCAVIRVSRP